MVCDMVSLNSQWKKALGPHQSVGFRSCTSGSWEHFSRAFFLIMQDNLAMQLLALRDGPSRPHCSNGGGAVMLPQPDEVIFF